MKQVLMLASENGALGGAKVGGMADVIRDLPAPLYEQGIIANLVMPSYGFLINQTNARSIGEFTVRFRGSKQLVRVFETNNPITKDALCYLLDHPDWHSTAGNLYTDSGNRPFADDANKFALFGVAVAEALYQKVIPAPDIIHLHDWHAGFYTLCTHLMTRFNELTKIPTVMTIHNLAIQGLRPLRDDESSLEAWFPSLWSTISKQDIETISDPRYRNCINPMRVAINFAQRVHVVSPTYANEVIKPSNSKLGYFGGEGLETDLINKGKKLFGIINGCNYDHQSTDNNFQEMTQLAIDTMLRWQGDNESVTGQGDIIIQRLKKLLAKKVEPDFLLTSVGRLTDQKVLILRQPYPPYRTVLEAILAKLAEYSDKALFIMLGSGDVMITNEFRRVAVNNPNFIFINGYAEQIAKCLYQQGDLFLMPSSFEPCGISQMLAMREGQPCLVHGVGGLNDTVEHDKSGFVFNGADLIDQSKNLIQTFEETLKIHSTDRWKKIKRSAKARRFSWQGVAKAMKKRLYHF